MASGFENKVDRPSDALDVLGEQDEAIASLLAKWREDTAELEDADSVQVRWERGSAAKLQLQHFALRESAIGDVCKHLRTADEGDLARRLDGDGTKRRALIGGFDEAIRGMQAISANTPEITDVLKQLGEIFDGELHAHETLVPDVVSVLGEGGDRDLASASYVRKHSPTHPNPRPKWYDRVGSLQAVRTIYDHLRGSPSGGTKPGVDSGRGEHDGLQH